MNKIKEHTKTIDIINEHLETFNKIFEVKKSRKKTILCLECGKAKKGEESTVNIYDNYWWICEQCEEELQAKLDCFNNDVEAGINFNISNQY